MTPTTLFDHAHKLMNCDCRLAAVKIPSVEALAERIIKGVDDAINSIGDSIYEYKRVSRAPGEFFDACKAWNYVCSHGFVKAFTQELESSCKAVSVAYRGDMYVVLETRANLSAIM